MPVLHLLETALYATNLNAMEQFYQTVLQLPLYSKENNRHLFFKLPNGMLLIFNPETTIQAGKTVPPHGATGSGHVAFAVAEAQLPEWRKRLHEYGVAIEKEVHWPGGGASIYFRDPAGNSVEITTPRIWKYPEELFWQRTAPSDEP